MPDGEPAVTTAESEVHPSGSWSLKPALTLGELLDRCGEELEKQCDTTSTDWQRAECLANLYLFACAIGSAVDDFLAGRVPAESAAVPVAVSSRDLLSSAAGWLQTAMGHHPLVDWKQRWEECLDEIARMLVTGAAVHEAELAALRRAIRNLLRAEQASSLLDWPIAINAGFRNQQLTDRDVPGMVDAFLAAAPTRNQPLLVVGVRTAGAWFAPLLAARLREHGWPAVDWVAMSPGHRLSRGERARLRQLQCSEVHALVVDDCACPERHLPLLLGQLRALGAEPERMTLLVFAPDAAARWSAPLPEQDKYCEVCFNLPEAAATLAADPSPDILAA